MMASLLARRRLTGARYGPGDRLAAGGSERAATKLVETYARAVDEHRLDEIDAALQGRPPTPFGVLLVGNPAHVSERETLT